MSTFGSPGGRQIVSKPIPPERGSFPLDHDAECQPLMKRYLACLKTSRGVNSDDCRQLSKMYLQCRMERNLMAPDSMRNLGFREDDRPEESRAENVDRQLQQQKGKDAADPSSRSSGKSTT